MRRRTRVAWREGLQPMVGHVVGRHLESNKNHALRHLLVSVTWTLVGLGAI